MTGYFLWWLAYISRSPSIRSISESLLIDGSFGWGWLVFYPDLLEWTRRIWNRRNVVDNQGPWEARLVHKSISLPSRVLSTNASSVDQRGDIPTWACKLTGLMRPTMTGMGAEERVLAVYLWVAASCQWQRLCLLDFPVQLACCRNINTET